MLFLYLFNRTQRDERRHRLPDAVRLDLQPDGTQTEVAVLIAAGVAASLAGIARPLLYRDDRAPDRRRARRPGRDRSAARSSSLLGVDAGEATQAVGALLLLGLIAAPAGAALRLTANPMHGLALSVAFALASIWGGVTAAYLIPTLPPSSAIIGVAVAIYAATSLQRVRR